jgi:hypothetical protein
LCVLVLIGHCQVTVSISKCFDTLSLNADHQNYPAHGGRWGGSPSMSHRLGRNPRHDHPMPRTSDFGRSDATGICIGSVPGLAPARCSLLAATAGSSG